MSNFVRIVGNALPLWAKRIVRKAAYLSISALPNDIDIKLIGLKYGTDKLGHGYLPHYDAHFAPLRKNNLNILEIGIGGYKDPKAGGASLRLWQDYFKNSQIFGLDIYEKSFHDDRRIKTFQGSQDDPSFLQEMASKIGNIDIIIDDGSHHNPHTIAAFNILFPLLNPNGIYVIEDTHTSYFPTYGGSFTDFSSTSTAIGIVKRLIDSLHYQYIPDRAPLKHDGQIIAIHCYPKIIFIKKGKNITALSNSDVDVINKQSGIRG